MSLNSLRRCLRRAAFWLLPIGLSLLLALVAAELVYRLQPVDLYRGELRRYNPPEDLAGPDPRPTVLFMGDSVTAGARSYPSIVRRARPDLRVVNAGIPGSSVLQANLVARGRFSRFNPSIFVYQVNVGNDLVNLRYPVSWRRLAPARNLYWTVAQRARSIEYLNYKLGQLARAREYDRSRAASWSAEPTEATCGYDFADFDPAAYTERIRLYLKAEPTLLEDQILVSGPRRDEYERLLRGLAELLTHCEPRVCTAFILVVPHASQVDAGYRDAMQRLGARFGSAGSVSAKDYPFVAGIRRFLAEHGMEHVRVLDALEALRDVERQGRHAYFLHDPHLNGCGQAALGRLLLREAVPG